MPQPVCGCRAVAIVFPTEPAYPRLRVPRTVPCLTSCLTSTRQGGGVDSRASRRACLASKIILVHSTE